MHRRYPWIAAALVLATVPVACMINVPDSGAGGSGGGGGNGYGGSIGGGDACNPVSGDGCSANGSACNLAPSGYFACFPPPDTVAVCGACDNDTRYCAAGLTCVFPNNMGDDGACFRYCCTDADCGAGATCSLALAASELMTMSPRDTVGLCVTPAMPASPACGAPATSPAPSGGECVGGYPGSPDGGTAPRDGGG